MLKYIWPIVIIVTANTVYHITSKSTPADVQPFASLTITYTVAAALSLLMFYITGSGKGFMGEMQKINWTSIVFGFAVVALEFGSISLYRAGWKISLGSLVANICLACVLVIVGVLLFKEHISARQLIGIGLCIAGIILISNNK
ncbi:MAG: EamA family transporter [Clostridiales bacterium]|jgi:uncharacterized membrane protein|nr:EamA family transporter [Clostridiales bacterium]HOJ35275.1 EamA family transporter [Clostridiales bacterium]HOL79477.1 EamA family transporter [Clostridiales bacterium]HPP68493.1 EamA family transporter [Clostridiales bacterium]HPU66505.1 EamA family transporter [Clostridiales bacterium]